MNMNHRARTRPWFVIAGLIVLVLGAGLLFWRAGARHHVERARARFEAAVARFHLNLGHPASVPHRDNAATWLRAAADLVDRDCIRKSIKLWRGRAWVRWTPAERDDAAACVASNREVLDLLHRAARCSGSNWDLEYSLEGHTPPFLNLLYCARLLAISSSLHLAAGETDPALEDLTAMAAIARSLNQEKMLITVLSGSAMEGLFLSTVSDAISAGLIGAAQVPALEAMLPRSNLVTAAQAALGVETEMLVEGSPAMLRDPKSQPLNTAGVLMVHAGSWLGIPWRETLTADLYDLGTRRLELVVTPYAELHANPPAPMSPHFPSGLVVPKNVFKHPIVVSIAGRAQETMAWRTLVRAGLALLRAARSQGRYPATLPEPFETRQLFCDCSPKLEFHDDGSARIFLPGAQKLSDVLWSWTEQRGYHRLELHLPPPKN